MRFMMLIKATKGYEGGPLVDFPIAAVTIAALATRQGP